jgi:hypothetical protein
MNRLAVTTLAGAAGMLLAACSSTHAPAPARKIVATVAPAGSPTPVSRTGALPPFRVGPLTQVFATPLPVSRGQRAVLTGFRTALLYWTRSGYAWRNVPGTTSYIIGPALQHVEAGERGLQSQGVVLGGTDRLFKTRVIGSSGPTASVLTCDDAAKVVEQDRATGIVVPQAGIPASDNYIFETYVLARHSGHWAIMSVSTAVLPQAAARLCQP